MRVYLCEFDIFIYFYFCYILIFNLQPAVYTLCMWTHFQAMFGNTAAGMVVQVCILIL